MSLQNLNFKFKNKTKNAQNARNTKHPDLWTWKIASMLPENVRTHMLQLEDPLKRNNNNKMYERAKKTRVKQLA